MINRTSMGMILVAMSLFGSCHAAGQTGNRCDGSWVLQKEKSTNIDPWGEWTISITRQGHSLFMVKDLRAGRYGQRDSMQVTDDGTPNSIPMHPGKWLQNVHLAVYGADGSKRTVVASSTDSTLSLTITETLPTAQDGAAVKITQKYAVSADNATLTMDETRSSRESGPPLHYVFSRSVR
jgi:hypothetical protein